MGAYLAIKSKNLFTTENYTEKQGLTSLTYNGLNSFTAVATYDGVKSQVPIVWYNFELEAKTYTISLELTSVGALTDRRPNELFIFKKSPFTLQAYTKMSATDTTNKKIVWTFTLPEKTVWRFGFYLSVSGSGTAVGQQTMTCENICLVEGSYTASTMPAYEPYYTYKRVKALTVSGNKFDINGAYTKNSSNISIDGNKIINKSVAGGNYEQINFNEIYPAGTYRIKAFVETTDNAKNYRPVIKTTTAISGMSYLALYGGYWKDIASGESFTFTAKDSFSLSFVYAIVTTGNAKTIYDISLRNLAQRCSIRMRPTTFPEQYQRVEYIESTGTQYIDTGVIGKSGLTAEMKMRWNALQKDGAFLGSRTNVDGAKRIYMCYMYNPNFETEQVGRWYIGYNVLKDTGIAIEKGRDYELKTILKNAKQEFYIDGERVWYEYVGGEVNTGLNLYLFNYNQDNSIISYCASSARLYYLTIYDGDKLVRKFIPCYRKSDGEIGLLDIVSGVFYTNQGTGKFEAYQKVEYIEGTGSQWIDTGYYPNETTNAEIDCEFINSGSTLYQPIMVVRNTVDGRVQQTFGYWGNGTTGELAFLYGGTDSGAITGTNLFGRHTIKNEKNKIYVDGMLVKEISPTYTTFVSKGSLPIFGYRNENNNVDTRSIRGRLYKLKIFDNGKLVRDFIPCYRISDGAVGLYDNVNSVFFTNQGTGTFKKGADV